MNGRFVGDAGVPASEPWWSVLAPSRQPSSPVKIADDSICRRYGFLKFQRALSLLGSNLASVGVLRPAAVRATGSLESGTDLGMMR